MRLGFALPQVGNAAGPEAVSTVAKRAEELGFDSLWVLDRLLYPVEPRAPYPVGDGTLPVQYKNSMDPLQTLAFAAAQTKRIAVGSSVLNLPLVQPGLVGAIPGDAGRSFQRSFACRAGDGMVPR